ncbi:MAG: SOS response-associated peptidase [Granulosicoccus sp.]|nr:SOS response-associated peptidase [Granulosicoccus sp.]
MCGRMNITDNEGIRLLMELVGMPSWPSIQARYNVAPSAQLDVVVRATDSKGEAASLEHMEGHWGLIPPWARPGQFSSPLINARSETVWEKPSFRNLIKHQRVCVPINGFYEWHREKSAKIPYFIKPADTRAMLIAGIYQRSADRTDITLLTTAANELMAPVHHRMPVVINSDQVDEWLHNDDPEILNQLMQPAANDVLTLQQVSDYVNNAKNEGPECVAAAGGSLL